MTDQRYALIWSIAGGSLGRGCFCPAGGLTKDEAETAKERLYARAETNNIRPVRSSNRMPQDITIGAAIVPYVYDLDRDDIEGLPLGVDRPEPTEGKTYSLNLGKSMSAHESVLMHVRGTVRVVEIKDGKVRFTGELPYSDSVSYDKRIFRSLSHVTGCLFELPRPRFAELYRETS
jgi:hypothetical protein